MDTTTLKSQHFTNTMAVIAQELEDAKARDDWTTYESLYHKQWKRTYRACRRALGEAGASNACAAAYARVTLAPVQS